MKTILRHKAMHAKLLIGWQEWVILPGLGVPGVRAKIDTGAKTSAIHAYRVRTEMRDGIAHAVFFVHPIKRRRTPEIAASAPLVDERLVTSSNGHQETRLVIQTDLQLGPYIFPIELTLTNRDAMGFRMLIGREALEDRFMVDVSASYACGDKSDTDFYPLLTSKRRKTL